MQTMTAAPSGRRRFALDWRGGAAFAMAPEKA
jgi:hypothetical protein